jgi:outer membrane protein assembly factor BamB
MARLGMILGAASVLLGGACATDAAFSPHFRDNNAQDLQPILARLHATSGGGVVNGTGHPVAYVVTTAPRKQLVAVDLGSGQPLWSQDANVTSRVWVGHDVVMVREGERDLVGRDVRSGAVSWRTHLQGKLVGVATEGDRAYYVAHGAEGRRSGVVVALDERSGGERWRREAQGSLGAPAARGGLVALPFMSQWLAILDGASGDELARVRSSEEQVTFARATPEGVFYGSGGVFALGERSVAGTRQGAAYLVAKFPGEFIRPVYAFDAYSPAQADYSAVDRNRVLWRAEIDGSGAPAFLGGQTILHTYRFFFAVDARTGALRWAFDHPRVDVVSAELAGRTLVLCAQDGVLEAVDATSGTRLWQGRVASGIKIAGATFDAEGWVPAATAAGAQPSLAQTLTHIVWDNDRRFGAVKLFAVDALAKLPERDVGAELVKILAHEGLGPQVYVKAGEALVARRDRDVVPLLLAELRKRYDHVNDVKPHSTDVLARAVAAAGAVTAEREGNRSHERSAAGPTASAELVESAWPVLVEKLRDPAAPPAALRAIATSLRDLGARKAVPALREFMLMYRADPAFAADPAPLEAVAEAIATLGSARDRELLRYVAEEPRTLDKLATYVRRELDQAARGRVNVGGAGGAQTREPALPKAQAGGKTPADEPENK